MAEVNNADIGFEDKIWKAADLLRGNMDASEYKSVVLGLIFLKYISDRFEIRYKELVDEGEGFEEDRDEYTSESVFYVPQDSRWDVIAKKARTPEIGIAIDDAMRHIEKENIKLSLKDGYLEVTAEVKKEENNDDNEKFVHKERYYGQCSRSFYVGDQIEEDEISAEFKNGILKICVPKKEEEKELPEVKHIEIK